MPQVLRPWSLTRLRATHEAFRIACDYLWGKKIDVPKPVVPVAEVPDYSKCPFVPAHVPLPAWQRWLMMVALAVAITVLIMVVYVSWNA